MSLATELADPYAYRTDSFPASTANTEGNAGGGGKPANAIDPANGSGSGSGTGSADKRNGNGDGSISGGDKGNEMPPESSAETVTAYSGQESRTKGSSVRLSRSAADRRDDKIDSRSGSEDEAAGNSERDSSDLHKRDTLTRNTKDKASGSGSGNGSGSGRNHNTKGKESERAGEDEGEGSNSDRDGDGDGEDEGEGEGEGNSGDDAESENENGNESESGSENSDAEDDDAEAEAEADAEAEAEAAEPARKYKTKQYAVRTCPPNCSECKGKAHAKHSRAEPGTRRRVAGWLFDKIAPNTFRDLQTQVVLPTQTARRTLSRRSQPLLSDLSSESDSDDASRSPSPRRAGCSSAEDSSEVDSERDRSRARSRERSVTTKPKSNRQSEAFVPYFFPQRDEDADGDAEREADLAEADLERMADTAYERKLRQIEDAGDDHDIASAAMAELRRYPERAGRRASLSTTGLRNRFPRKVKPESRAADERNARDNKAQSPVAADSAKHDKLPGSRAAREGPSSGSRRSAPSAFSAVLSQLAVTFGVLLLIRFLTVDTTDLQSNPARAQWLRVKDVITTPLGLSKSYIPGCQVIVPLCRNPKAAGLEPGVNAVDPTAVRAVFIESQSLFWMKGNSSAAGTENGCAETACKYHELCRNNATEPVLTRLLYADEPLCEYPPREPVSLVSHFRAIGWCSGEEQCDRAVTDVERFSQHTNTTNPFDKSSNASNATLITPLTPLWGERMANFTGDSEWTKRGRSYRSVYPVKCVPSVGRRIKVNAQTGSFELIDLTAPTATATATGAGTGTGTGTGAGANEPAPPPAP